MFTSPSKGRGLVAVPLLAILPIILVALLGEPPAKTRAQNAAAAKAPVAPVRVVTDEYFGVKVADPSRGMKNRRDAGRRLLLSEAARRRRSGQAVHAGGIGWRGKTDSGSDEVHGRRRRAFEHELLRGVAGWPVGGGGNFTGGIGRRGDPYLRRADRKGSGRDDRSRGVWRAELAAGWKIIRLQPAAKTGTQQRAIRQGAFEPGVFARGRNGRGERSSDIRRRSGGDELRANRSSICGGGTGHGLCPGTGGARSGERDHGLRGAGGHAGRRENSVGENLRRGGCNKVVRYEGRRHLLAVPQKRI